jgi:transforming growth factor-beta-induced protein
MAPSLQISSPMKHIKYFFAIIILSFTYSCSVDEGEVELRPKTMLDLVQESSNYTYLTYAISKTGLSNTLSSNNANLTLFAPDDMAFGRFLMQNGFRSIDEIPVDILKKVLLNHVLGEPVEYSKFKTGYYNTAAQIEKDDYKQNLSMHIEEVNMRITLNGESIITRAVRAENGIVHAVNRVIPLPTIVTFAKADKNLEILLAALTRPDLTADFPSILSTDSETSPAPFTVFAPTNQAFVDLLQELGANSLSDIDEPTLKSTLTYHVIAETLARSSQLSDNLQLETLGGTITANVTGGATLTDGNNRVSNIIAVDIQADNGVIHVIDKVILPN